jgi:hypothetical protein
VGQTKAFIGTAWGAWNSVIEYEDYQKTRRQAASVLAVYGIELVTVVSIGVLLVSVIIEEFVQNIRNRGVCYGNSILYIVGVLYRTRGIYYWQ